MVDLYERLSLLSVSVGFESHTLNLNIDMRFENKTINLKVGQSVG